MDRLREKNTLALVLFPSFPPRIGHGLAKASIASHYDTTTPSWAHRLPQAAFFSAFFSCLHPPTARNLHIKGRPSSLLQNLSPFLITLTHILIICFRL
jgi:hypothetical protein